MSFKATLFIFDKEYPLLDADYQFNQNVDYSNRPNSRVFGGKINASLQATSDESGIYGAVISPDEKIKGHIRFFKRDGLQKEFDLKFANAYIVLVTTHYSSDGKANLVLDIQISALIMEIRNSIYESPVNPNNPFSQEVIPVTTREEKEEETPVIKEAFWLSEGNSQLSQSNGLNTDVYYGQKVKLKIITQHTPDNENVEVIVKAKTADGYIDIEDDTGALQQTLTVKGNEAISDPIYLNPNWYNEEIENYNYQSHQTEINKDEALTLVFDAKLDSGDEKEALPENDTHKLKPITYRRNYEELIGLFNTNNSGEKDKQQNYENKFIDGNSKIKSIVDEFIEKVITQDITISEIKSLVNEKAKALWEAAVKQVQGGNLDDRPLYWARNKMETWLKRNPLFKDQIDFDTSIIKKGTELDTIITLFEEKSRNYTGIDFSNAGNKKKVLITGFDPFLLNSFDHKYKNGFNILQSNPSGCVALSLGNENIENTFIQTLIVPVRYTDFDDSQENNKGQGKGIIEKYIEKLIDEVDMIVTISQYLKGQNVIDMFSTIRRGGFNDNKDFTRENQSKAIVSNDEWIKTTLPVAFSNIPLVKMNWRFNNINHSENTFPQKNQMLIEGSGGDYLSNEIFYRVAKLRKDKRPNLPTGHFHIEKLQDERINEDFSNAKISILLELIKKSLKEGIKFI
ncbi:type VI secretion system tube protein TssD [uncultured Aquimarina sp.]|uniref:type VI secretion system tube protein TssD n=1 Tax=uncultured Aquimarina sp. TaxID=575652 RepID=UPI002625C97D|nr:type VI secretion system tube protein TssD [uncultured Aquimarina sp.]